MLATPADLSARRNDFNGPLDADARCDVCVLGAGVTGALIADRFSEAGLDVVVLDKGQPAAGSTAMSTCLLMYDLDVMLHRLIEQLGEAAAVRAYRLGAWAVERVGELCRDAEAACGFANRRSLMLARPGDGELLRREHDGRAGHGFEVEWLDTRRLREQYDIDRPSAIRTGPAAEVDGGCLTSHLLRRAASRGVRVHPGSGYERIDGDAERPVVVTEAGFEVACKRVVLATGYHALRHVPEGLVDMSVTFAAATEPVADFGPWSQRELIWETGSPYTYLRTTPDRRVIVGGGDVPLEQVKRDGRSRDAWVAEKAEALLAQQRRLLPWIDRPIDRAWGGLFGNTADGLPYIGEVDVMPGCLFALGYGGNGVTFSVIAADVLLDAVRGREHPDAGMFAFGRRGDAVSVGV
jgi:glycine/D-amino acid oxidase-like deaminating enzyme